jgi:hypothetical protein
VVERGVWKDIGDGSEGREFAQLVTSKGSVWLDQTTPAMSCDVGL